MNSNTFLLLVIILLFGYKSNAQNKPNKNQYDIVVYGATSAGITAAIQAARMNHTVLMIEPSNRIGGQTTGGLGQTDIGNKHTIGGISKEFYQNIKKYYSNSENWKWQDRSDYKPSHSHKSGNDDTMWTFEPSAALKVYQDMLKSDKITIHYKQRLNRKTGVKKKDGKIITITMESGKVYHGKMFIDASYEGDLMAASKISYIIGREANSVYGEKLNGVQTKRTGKSLNGHKSKLSEAHNFVSGVDPYIIKGDSTSGTLPYINESSPGIDGKGDKKIQAYAFRMCLTKHTENKISFDKPANYKELNYELLFRNFENGYDRIPWSNNKLPNNKTDTNNKGGFSTDFIGQNYNYPEASYKEREKILEEHRNYQKGLMWTLANHKRVPQKIREEVSKWGTCKDEFEREDGWPQQLYIREARRMVSDLVITEKHDEGIEKVNDGIGLASYTMDSHHVQRYITQKGHVFNEGNVEAVVHKPFPISYRSIIPKKTECTNLLVPVCLSASHIAFASIRMEPVFMILGQSAATAASIAIKSNKTLQDIDYSTLKNRLIKDNQQL